MVLTFQAIKEFAEKQSPARVVDMRASQSCQECGCLLIQYTRSVVPSECSLGAGYTNVNVKHPGGKVENLTTNNPQDANMVYNLIKALLDKEDLIVDYATILQEIGEVERKRL